MHAQDIHALHQGRNAPRMKLLAMALTSGALLASTAALADGGDTWQTATPITSLPFTDTGTTAGKVDDYDLPPDTTAPTLTATCAGTAVGGGPGGAAPRGGVYTGSGTGPDAVYSIAFPNGNPDTLTISVTTPSFDGNVTVFCNTVSNNLSDGLVIDDDGSAGATESVTVGNIVAGTTLYIVVDGYSAGATPPGPSGAFTISVTSNGSTQPGGEPEPDVANLSVTLTDAPDPVNVGDTITYTATVNNTGPDIAENVDLNIPLPAEVAFASINPGTASCTTPAVGASGTVNCDWTSIGASGGATVVISATAIAPSATGGSGAAATASVDSDADDPDMGNNSAITFTTINAAPGPGPGGVEPTYVTVPTLGSYTTALLGALLGLFGFAAFRRRG